MPTENLYRIKSLKWKRSFNSWLAKAVNSDYHIAPKGKRWVCYHNGQQIGSWPDIELAKVSCDVHNYGAMQCGLELAKE